MYIKYPNLLSLIRPPVHKDKIPFMPSHQLLSEFGNDSSDKTDCKYGKDNNFLKMSDSFTKINQEQLDHSARKLGLSKNSASLAGKIYRHRKNKFFEFFDTHDELCKSITGLMVTLGISPDIKTD